MKTVVYIIFILVVLLSCKKKESEQPLPETGNDKGFFVVNEGNYTWGNASLSFYNYRTGLIENQVFYRVNNIPLGDVALHMQIYNNKGFIVVNNSGKIYVINPFTYQYLGSIQGFTSPRNLLFLNDTTLLVSDLYNTNISVVNPETYQITRNIPMGTSTEGMVISGDNIYVSSWSFNNKIFVLDKNQLAVIDTIEVGKQPRWVKTDANQNIWVLCDGGYAGSSYGHENPSIYCIDKNNHAVLTVIHFPSKQFSAFGLDCNEAGDSLFFIFKDVYGISISDTQFPSQAIISSNGNNFYQLTYNQRRNEIIVSDAKNYTSDGKVMIYKSDGQFIKELSAGIIPSSICFRNGF